ncbi:MAG: rhodanese-like domain-containing protein [Acidimicrobiales bacterium]
MDNARALIVGAVATDESAAEVDSISARAFPRSQIRGRFGSILLGSDVIDTPDALRRLLAHNCAVHLEPGGSLAVSVTTAAFAADLAECGFERTAKSGDRSFWRRTERYTIHDVTAEARSSLDRITTAELAGLLQRREPATVIDIRIPDDRRLHGVIPGSVPIPRTVLEWRADPTSGYSHPALGAFHQPVVVVCNEGYSSSIAAAALKDLGYTESTDLIGGVVAWAADAHPVDPAPPQAAELFIGPVEDL